MEMSIVPKKLSGEGEDDSELMPESGVLPPDHPLMEKFQRAFTEHLMKIKRQLDEENDELDEQIRLKDIEIAETGAMLFEKQTEIANQREQLDRYSKSIIETSDRRRVHEENAAKLKAEFKIEDLSCKEYKRLNNELTQELHNMKVLESEISRWNEEIQNEIALAKRVATKDSKDQRAISEEKRMMDLILFKLDFEVRKNESELANIEDQIQEHADSVAELNKSLADANVDLEGLQQEHKKLMQAWGEIIVSVQHRDKILAKARAELHNQHEGHKTIQSHIDNTKKFILKELETSEKLNEFKERLLRDMTNVEKQVQITEGENIKLDQKLDHFALILNKTECDLEQARSEGLLTKNHITKLTNKLEKLARDKFEIEERILDLLQDQITTDKAGQHRGRLLREAQEERRTLEIAMSQIENKLSFTILELEKWRGNVQSAKDEVEHMKKEHNEADFEANIVTDEIEKLKLTTKNKLIQLDVLHKELEKMIEQLGGKEMNLKEVQIVDLEKKIAEIDARIKDSQQFWLRLQSNVVNLSERRAKQLDEIFVGRKQLMVVEQKALKVESELEATKNEHREVLRSLTNLNVKLDATSALLYEKRKVHEKEEVECETAHQETVDKLKDAEMNVLQMEQELCDLSREIEECKKEVQVKHYEALSWETKFKMAVEAKKMRDDELSKSSEIGVMKAEIHRMECKYSQLKKLLEKMSNDLAASVFHRDHIHDAAHVRDKRTGSKTKTQSNIKHKLNEMENKLKITKTELSATQRQLKEYETRDQQLRDEITAKEQDIQNERMQDCLLQTEIEQSLLLKQQNLENIVKRQKRAKRYKMLQSCTYLPKMRSESAMEAEMKRQEEIRENLIAILESLMRDFPAHKFSIEKIFQTLKN